MNDGRLGWVERLRKKRKDRLWSVPRLARELRVVAAEHDLQLPDIESVIRNIRRWEAGQNRPDESYSELLARVYQTTEGELFGQAERSAPSSATGETAPSQAGAVHLDPRTTRLVSQDTLELSRTGDEQEDVQRREFLRLGGMLAGAAALDPGLLLGLGSGSVHLDGEVLDHHDRLLRHFARETWTAPSGGLVPVVRVHLSWLQSLLGQPLSPPLSRRVQLLVGRAAAVLGRLSYQVENRGDALRYWSLAEGWARATGDGPLQAHVLVERSRLYSRSSYSNPRPDSDRAIALLDQAEALAGAADPHLLAWLKTRRAMEFAVLGHGSRCGTDIDMAARALGNARCSPTGLFTEWNETMLGSFYGSCILFLRQHLEAIRLLEETIATTSIDSLRAVSMMDLAVAYARHGEGDSASHLLSKALDLCVRDQYWGRIQGIAGIRVHELARWSDSAGVRRLDAQLRTVT